MTLKKGVNFCSDSITSPCAIMPCGLSIPKRLPRIWFLTYSAPSGIQRRTYQSIILFGLFCSVRNRAYKETIFAVQYSENSVDLSSRFLFWFAPHTSAGAVTKRPNINIIGAGWNQPTQDLINAFEPGDKRKDVSIGFWTGVDWDSQTRAIPYCAKYKPPVSAPDDRCSDNLPVLRYSNVLLMYAETLNELGRTSEALPFVQQVRTRAGLTNSLTGLDKTALQTLIAKERQVEFCFENQRWYDLKRTGKAVEVMNAHGLREKAQKTFLYPEAYTVTANKLVAPVPNIEVLVNKIAQNPGY